ncbi:MAG: MMPL family transporter [Bacteroidaceae bacterium]|nr:MMPL family transporter [Bacteroidaceae bacterium]
MSKHISFFVTRLLTLFRAHPFARIASLTAVTLVMLCSVLRLSYKEDIQDFLPLGETDRQRMAVYQDISGMNRLFVIFESNGDAERTTQAIDRFALAVEEKDTAGWCSGLQTAFDLESLSEQADFVFSHIPLFLAEADYRRMDSLLASNGFMDSRLDDDLSALTFPTGGLAEQNIGRDPLGLFTPLLEELGQQAGQMRFEMYDGYIFTPDMKHAVAMLPSPFGSSETARNAALIALLEEAVGTMQADFPDIKAHVAGGPQIAVGNARQIARDSILAVSLAVVLILGLLFYAFRRWRSILLTCFSVLWGWLFALGALALVHDNVSMIVVGISSIIIGIAVNYPLHLVSHLQHQPDVRQTLREVTKPLLVGNVTTVAAFLALVPLRSASLRDLGLFASFLHVGTILFVLVWLPHALAKSEKLKVKNKSNQSPDFLSRLASLQIERKKWVVALVAALTLVFGYFSLSVEFDPNVSHINYMTEEQKADMDYFGKLMEGDGSGDMVRLYLLSFGTDFDEALSVAESRQAVIDSLQDAGLLASRRGVKRFLPSEAEQARRIGLWKEWREGHRQLLADLNAVATRHGFADDAFADFADIILSEPTAHPFSDFLPLTSNAFAGNVSLASKGKACIAEVLTTKKENADRLREALPEAFDISSLHASVAEALSADFNYIGWVCSSVVFLFLWLSFRSFRLAVISFVPMAVSWIWILGIMALLGIKFNIVNIILATFIFGQGDDYTIFMTEGCVSEYANGRPVLVSYKRSIILSALIMFIGIGTLIFARHPALHSLAEVTIIGMSCVVLMAYLLPPLLFNLSNRITDNIAHERTYHRTAEDGSADGRP